MSSDTLYTLEEAATLLNLRPQTLRRWIRQGKIPAKRVGKQWRLRRQDLEQAIQPRTPNAQELNGFEQAALTSLTDVWDNAEDAIYDHWKELYGVPKG